jgi:hypothetical protein
MNDLSETLNVGDLLIIETGEYSDLCYHGPVKMLVTATKQQLADEYRENWTPNDSWEVEDKPDNYGFLPWLVRTGKAEDLTGTVER